MTGKESVDFHGIAASVHAARKKAGFRYKRGVESAAIKAMRNAVKHCKKRSIEFDVVCAAGNTFRKYQIGGL